MLQIILLTMKKATIAIKLFYDSMVSFVQSKEAGMERDAINREME